MASFDDVPAEDLAMMQLASELRDSGNLHPLIAQLRDGEIGPEHARDALRILAEIDVDLLVQITLDALITEYVVDPGLAHQPRRVVRPGEEGADGE